MTAQNHKPLILTLLTLLMLIAGTAGNGLSAQTTLELYLEGSRADWGATLYNMEDLERGRAWQVSPQAVLRSGRLYAGLQWETAVFEHDAPLFQSEFINDDGARILWQQLDAVLHPARSNLELDLGVLSGSRAAFFLSFRFVRVGFDERLSVEEFQYQSDTASWMKLGDKKVTYDPREDRSWIGFGSRFTLPVFYHRLLLEGTAKYYIWGESGINIIKVTALVSRPLSRSFTLFAGGHSELVTSGELLESMFSLRGGIRYTFRGRGK